MSLDLERAKRAVEFVQGFKDSSCWRSQACQSWMREARVAKVYAEDVDGALAEISKLLSEGDQFQNNIDRLQNDMKRHGDAKLTAEAEVNSLTGRALDTAVSVLRDHHLGLDANSAADILSNQAWKGKVAFAVGGHQIVVTVFGVFSYPLEVDLTHGEKPFDLIFHPYIFPALGKAVEADAASEKLSVQPRLAITADGVDMHASDCTSEAIPTTKPLDLGGGDVGWHWCLKQRFWSWLRDPEGEANAKVALKVFSSAGSRDVEPGLPFKVKGRPWWWLLSWFWENVLLKPQVWSALIVGAVIARQRGPKSALDWAWGVIQRMASGSPAKGE